MQNTIHNVIIVGGGCAGYTAGTYAGRAELSPVLIEGTYEYGYRPGGQLTMTTDVENYPGHEKISGLDVIDIERAKAIKWGTTIIEKSVTKVDFTSRPFKIFVNDESEPLLSKTIIIATGANSIKLEIPGESTYWTKGISSCAVCDGSMYRNKKIFVVGGGDSAMEEALYLAKSNFVTIVHRGSAFRASKIMQKRVLEHKKINVIWNTEVIECIGNALLTDIKLKNKLNNVIETVKCDGLFYGLGHSPNTKFLENSGLKFDDQNYILTIPGTTHTNIEGVFAAGDVQDRRYRQAVTAAASGCQAALDANKHLAE